MRRHLGNGRQLIDTQRAVERPFGKNTSLDQNRTLDSDSVNLGSNPSSPASNKHRCFLQNSAISDSRKKWKWRNRTRTSADTQSDTVVRPNFLRTDRNYWPAGERNSAPDKRQAYGRSD